MNVGRSGIVSSCQMECCIIEGAIHHVLCCDSLYHLIRTNSSGGFVAFSAIAPAVARTSAMLRFLIGLTIRMHRRRRARGARAPHFYKWLGMGAP